CRLPSCSGRAISGAFVGARVVSALSYVMILARALHATGAALTSAETSCEWQPSVKDTLIDPDNSNFRAVHEIFWSRQTPLYPAGAENILTKSSDFSFLPPLSNARS